MYCGGRDTISFSINVKNTGSYNGEEVVQVYIHYPQQPGMPVKELKAFRRISIDKNKESVAIFRIPLNELQKWDIGKHAWQLSKGSYKIVIGGNADENRLTAMVSIN